MRYWKSRGPSLSTSLWCLPLGKYRVRKIFSDGVYMGLAQISDWSESCQYGIDEDTDPDVCVVSRLVDHLVTQSSALRHTPRISWPRFILQLCNIGGLPCSLNKYLDKWSWHSEEEHVGNFRRESKCKFRVNEQEKASSDVQPHASLKVQIAAPQEVVQVITGLMERSM